jgi:hypothetical protein
MTFSKIKLFGLLALSCSLIACGQTPVSTAPNASPNAIGQTTTAPQPTETPVVEVKSPEPQPSAMAPAKTGGAANPDQCNNAIRQSTLRLESISNVTVVTGDSQFKPLKTPYPDEKAGLNRSYMFGMRGSGLENAWKSRELLTEVTKEITTSCIGTAAVIFARLGSGEAYTMGIFPDGSVKFFTCGADYDGPRGTRPPLPWGQEICGL